MSRRPRSPRLAIARILGGISYNLAAGAYVLILAVVVGVLLSYYSGSQGAETTTPAQELAVLGYSARASVVSTAIGIVIAFFVGALSLLLLAWVPYKIAKIGATITAKVSAYIFDNSASGTHMFIAKLLVYGPAIILLIILYLVFSSELTFQLLTAGSALVVSAVVFAALRLLTVR